MFRKPALLTQLVYVILLFGLIILKWSNIISFEAGTRIHDNGGRVA